MNANQSASIAEAIENANAYLNNVSIPNYSELLLLVDRLRKDLASMAARNDDGGAEDSVHAADMALRLAKGEEIPPFLIVPDFAALAA